MPKQESQFPWTLFVIGLAVIGGGLIAFFTAPFLFGGGGHAQVVVVPDLGLVSHSEWSQAKKDDKTTAVQLARADAPLRAEPSEPLTRPSIAETAPPRANAAPPPRVKEPVAAKPSAEEEPAAPVRPASPAPAEEREIAATEPEEPARPARTGDVQPPYELEITATARQVWVWVSIDGGPEQAVSLERGDSTILRAEDGYVLTVDDAGGVEATLNGKSLPSFGAPARARRDLIIPSAEWSPIG